MPANRSPQLICTLLVCVALPACSARQNAPAAPDSAALLAGILASDPAKLPDLSKTKVWHNPYLVIRTDGVGLITNVAVNEEQILKPEEVLDTLAHLPASAWPYGRVTAILMEEKSASPEQDKIAMRRNRGIVAGALQSAQVAIRWVPVPES